MSYKEELALLNEIRRTQAAEISELKAKLDNPWISINDRVPADEDDMVLWKLVTHPRKVVCMSLKETRPAGVDITSGFSDWMPIPGKEY